jgi:hypothetical protein
MNILELQGKFIENLSDEQKGLIQDYYFLTTRSIVSPQEEIEQLGHIWQKAESDEKLTQWLELIDYFYSSVEEEDREFDSEDRRSHVSEYLNELLVKSESKPLKLPQQRSEKFDDVENFEDLRQMNESEPLVSVFLCPHGEGFTVVPVSEQTPEAIADLGQQVCGQCHRKLQDHHLRSVNPLRP